jgi:hypothetical protein
VHGRADIIRASGCQRMGFGLDTLDRQHRRVRAPRRCGANVVRLRTTPAWKLGVLGGRCPGRVGDYPAGGDWCPMLSQRCLSYLPSRVNNG